MTDAAIAEVLARVDPDRLAADLHYLCADPLPRRTVNFTRPGADRCSLYEADDFLTARLTDLGYTVERQGVPVQAFRCDPSKPKAHQYAPPAPEDPWHEAFNLSVRRPGRRCPQRTLVALGHKDSQSWVASPGAYDNGVGTVAVLELARILAEAPLDHSLWLLWCNEEHTPWTSVAAAQAAAERGEDLAAIFNLDSLGGRSESVVWAGRRTAVTVYTCDQGRPFAELIGQVVADFGLDLEASVVRAEFANDDDGMFIKAGYPHAVKILGSFPYAHRWYHDERDTADGVDISNVALSTQAVLAALLRLDAAD
jgi:hypothetical protein